MLLYSFQRDSIFEELPRLLTLDRAHNDQFLWQQPKLVALTFSDYSLVTVFGMMTKYSKSKHFLYNRQSAIGNRILAASLFRKFRCEPAVGGHHTLLRLQISKQTKEKNKKTHLEMTTFSELLIELLLSLLFKFQRQPSLIHISLGRKINQSVKHQIVRAIWLRWIHIHEMVRSRLNSKTYRLLWHRIALP